MLTASPLPTRRTDWSSFSSLQNASALSRDRDATATSVQRWLLMMALAFFFAIEAQPMIPMRTVYGEASIASAAREASRAAIFFRQATQTDVG